MQQLQFVCRKSDITEGTILDTLEQKLNMSLDFNPVLSDQFFELDCKEHNLPSNEVLLAATEKIVEEIGGLRGWRAKGVESRLYRGFSPVFNPENGVDHWATWGDLRLRQTLSITRGQAPEITNRRNSYYDTYAFNEINPIVKKHYAELFDRFACQPTRSRVAFLDRRKAASANDDDFHIDEFAYQNIRVLIPIQTDSAYKIEIRGTDEHGNSMHLKKSLEVGKFYIWNQRIPHRVFCEGSPKTDLPRIHIILGFMPWIRIIGDDIFKSEFYGIQPFDLIKSKKFFR